MSAADVILFLCHRWDRSSRRHLQHLRRTKPAELDLWIVSDARSVGAPPAGVPVYEFSRDDLLSRGYSFSHDDITPGSAHLPILEFARCHSDYGMLWVVEYDVAFTGRWDEILSTLAAYDADLVAPHLRRHADEPGWEWWASMRRCGTAARESEWIRGFLPFYRLSRRAAELLRQASLAGRAAHFEAFVPTELHRAGLRIMDCGGDGEFTPAELRSRFYHSESNAMGELAGSLRYRPLRARPGPEASYLYHPVKRPASGASFGWRPTVQRLARLFASPEPKEAAR